MNNKSPFGLNEWLLYLQDRKFPVGSDSIAKLKKQIKTPDETLDRMQKNIASEPLLAFAILNQANTMVEYKRNDIKSPIHAASMIGMTGIGKVFDVLEPVTIQSKNDAHAAFLREVQISYEAAAIAKRWAIEKKISHIDDVYWITFFRDVTRWLLWFHAHDEMEQVTQKIRRGSSSSQAEAAVLGCRIDELAVALFKYWKVPTVIIESFLTDQIPTAEELQSIARLTHTPDQLPGFAEDKRITILMNGPLILAYCATRVAQEANIVGWGSKNLPFFYRVVAAILHIRLGYAVQLTHFATTEAAREVKHLGKPSLAAHLLSPILFTRSSAQAGTVKRVAANPLNQLQSKLKDISDSKQRATLAMKAMLTLFKGSSSAVLILHHNKADEKLRPILQFGFDTDILRRVRWNSPSSVISKLNTKRVAVHFDNTKLNAMSKDMPEGTDKLFEGTQDLFLASSPIDEANTYIYWLFGQTQLNREQFDTFKKIIKLADQ